MFTSSSTNVRSLTRAHAQEYETKKKSKLNSLLVFVYVSVHFRMQHFRISVLFHTHSMWGNKMVCVCVCGGMHAQRKEKKRKIRRRNIVLSDAQTIQYQFPLVRSFSLHTSRPEYFSGVAQFIFTMFVWRCIFSRFIFGVYVLFHWHLE